VDRDVISKQSYEPSRAAIFPDNGRVTHRSVTEPPSQAGPTGAHSHQSARVSKLSPPVNLQRVRHFGQKLYYSEKISLVLVLPIRHIAFHRDAGRATRADEITGAGRLMRHFIAKFRRKERRQPMRETIRSGFEEAFDRRAEGSGRESLLFGRAEASARSVQNSSGRFSGWSGPRLERAEMRA
jgi:hypothetical protein